MEELPVYRVENWPSQDFRAGVSGMMVHSTVGSESEDVIVMSRGTFHGDGDRSVSVTSSWPRDSDREDAGRQLAQDRMQPRKWGPVDIAVGGHNEVFELATVGTSWVAVATIGGVTITVTGHNVDVANVRLVEDVDAPKPDWHRPVLPEPRGLTFPSTFDPVPPGSPPVDLTFRNRRVFTGTVGGRAVELIGDLPAHRSSVRGRVGGITVGARWESDGEQVSLSGSFGDLPVTLRGRFGHQPSFCFDAADVSGHIGVDPLVAHIERADGGLSTSTVYAEGTLAQVAFSLWATLAGDLTRGMVRGSVAGRPFELHATSDYHHLHIAGSYEGPDALLVVIVGSLANFI